MCDLKRDPTKTQTTTTATIVTMARARVAPTKMREVVVVSAPIRSRGTSFSKVRLTLWHQLSPSTKTGR